MFGRKSNSHLALAAKRLEKMEKALAAVRRPRSNSPAVGHAEKLISELDRCYTRFQTVIRRMENHASGAEARMKKLSVAGTASWSAFQTALTKSQKAFARANRKTGKAFRRAVK